MKRGTPEHPKVKRLMQALGIGQAQAVGHLELLFHFAAARTPRGDIGKWSNPEIALAAAWTKDADRFIAALVATRWVEVAPDPYRLVIHDWHEHADQTVQRNVANKGGFVSLLAETSVDERVLASASLARGKAMALALAPAGGSGGNGRSPKVPWPADFTLTEKRTAFAIRYGLEPVWEWNKFHTRAERDDVRYCNWDRAWEYWCRNAKEFERKPTHGR